jgi:citrate synthase
VLAADHELSLVAFVGRALVSADAPASAALLGAMCTLGARFNGGATAQVEALWDALSVEPHLSEAVAARLARGESLAGFNHLAYPRGDPRAIRLLGLAQAFAPAPALVSVVQLLAGWAPSIDFALVALRRALGAPRGAALALQMAGRCVGVLAHVLEQRRSGQRIIVRARYVGPLPAEDTA